MNIPDVNYTAPKDTSLVTAENIFSNMIDLF